MSKKKGNFIDQYLDKIILGLTAILSLYLMWAFVLSNPYGAEVNNQKLSPAQIDTVNLRQAQAIVEKLGQTASPKPYSQNKADEMSKMIDDALPKISTAISWPRAGGGQTGVGDDRKYVIPSIPMLQDVKYASIRGTVQMPTDEVTPEVTYTMVASKPQDLDLVTFSAKVNLQALYDNFRQSFMGMRLKPQWRDPSYAEPVIARIELQRRIQKSDGTWGEWETVPFNRIDPYQKMFKDLPLTTEQMTYGSVDLFMNSYRDFAVMKDILQPSPYEFLMTRVKWLPAQYYLESQKISEEQEQQKLREERDRRQKERTPTNPARPSVGGGGMDMMRRQPGAQPARGGRGGGGGIPMDPMMGMPQPVRPAKPTRSVQDIERDALAAKIDEKTKLSSMKDVLVWIHDDSAAAGVNYQYRIRYGVFNPIAGKDWFAPESKDYKNQVVLWSAFTEIPETVRIPKMLHMFPMDLLADKSGVTVEIYRYYMGQWHTENFDVRFGQMIGKAVEFKPKTGTEGMPPGLAMGGMPMPMPMGNAMIGMDGLASNQPLLVDYSTGCMLLDVRTDTNWIFPGMLPREVSTMLYLDGNNQLLSLATRKSNVWSREMSAEYNAVKSEVSKSAGMMLDGTMMLGGEGFPPEMINRVQDRGGL